MAKTKNKNVVADIKQNDSVQLKQVERSFTEQKEEETLVKEVQDAIKDFDMTREVETESIKIDDSVVETNKVVFNEEQKSISKEHKKPCNCEKKVQKVNKPDFDGYFSY